MERVLLTAPGAERLHAELKKLKSTDRPNVIAAIAEARAHGDLSENAEYEAAREQQGFIEGRINELESNLSIAEIIDASRASKSGKIVFGSTVTLFEESSDAEVKYQIVGDLEANLDAGQISLGSPIARALIGKQEGDEVKVKTPGGDRSYEVLSITYV